MVFYTNRFIPEGSAGKQRGPFIFIRPEYKGDHGLLEHEKVHVRQAWRGLLAIHGLLYRFLPEYRLASEVEAYREQARHYPNDRRLLFAIFISEKYDLKITPEAALKLLME